MAAGAVGWVGVLDAPWDTCDYYVPYDGVARPISGLWLSRSSGAELDRLLDAGPVTGRLDVDARRDEVVAHNVIGTLPGRLRRVGRHRLPPRRPLGLGRRGRQRHRHGAGPDRALGRRPGRGAAPQPAVPAHDRAHGPRRRHPGLHRRPRRPARRRRPRDPPRAHRQRGPGRRSGRARADRRARGALVVHDAGARPGGSRAGRARGRGPASLPGPAPGRLRAHPDDRRRLLPPRRRARWSTS